MGLSRKLGQSGNQPAGYSGSNDVVAYQWSHQSYTMQDILKKFKLPCVVQCATDSCSVVWSEFQFDLRQPLLMYSLRTVKKIHARSLNRNTLEEFGPPVAIPEDYDGWFASTPKGVNALKRHTRVQGVVDANVPIFLVCSKCPAFTSSKGAEDSFGFIPHDVAAGETLKRVCVMEGEIDESNTPPIVQRYGPCLECLDEKGEDVVIPLSHRVMSYEVADNFPCDEHKVFNTKSLIAAGNKHLPRMLTVIQGDPPSLPYSFTGLYRFYSVFTEETIFAATLDNNKSICLELATDSGAKFNIGLNDVVIKKTCEYNNALQVCHKVGDKFSSGIKVSFSLTPVNTLDDIDLSLYDNMSSDDVQEVDANSEFEIAWGSGGKSNIKSRELINRKNGNDSAPSEIKSVEQCDLEKGMNTTTDNISATEKPKEYTRSPPQLNSLENIGLLQTAVHLENGNVEDTIPTSCGEDILKENPLFLAGSHEAEKEFVSNLEFESEDMSEISDDIIEMSLDETDYGSMVIKKANEYNEDLPSSDNSDSEIEDSINQCDKTNEANYTSNELEGNNISFDQDSARIGVISNNGIKQTESNCQSNSCENVYEPIALNIETNHNSETFAIADQAVKSSHEHTVNLSHNSVETSYENYSHDNAGTAVQNISDIPKQNQPSPEKSRELTQSSNRPESIPKSGHEKVQTHSSKSLPHKTKSMKKLQSHDSDKKADISRFMPWIDRLRKFKSGSNVNVCSNLDLVAENRYQSSKVKLHPHTHPHKHMQGNVINAFQGTDLCQRETTQDNKGSHEPLKVGLFKMDTTDKSTINLNKKKIVAVSDTNQHFSTKLDMQQDKKNEEITTQSSALEKAMKLIDQEEEDDKLKTNLQKTSSFENNTDVLRISSVDGLDEDYEEFA